MPHPIVASMPRYHQAAVVVLVVRVNLISFLWVGSWFFKERAAKDALGGPAGRQAASQV